MTLLAVGVMSGGLRFVCYLLALICFAAAALVYRTPIWPPLVAAGLALATVPPMWDALAIA